MTIDNPIEIREPKFTQMQVHYADAESANFTEKKILKVALRSDPDMFLYNEIRDEEDARVALEASTTGHRVFSTVHAGNCVKTILRLLGLDVSRILLLSEIRMIISQRLVGMLCPHWALARLFNGYSCAKIESVLNGAALRAGQQDRSEFTLEDVKAAAAEC
jgi:type II secretory ATPase GspE/PulE/Tfp pilus assembly ATPase PilB-like protein